MRSLIELDPAEKLILVTMHRRENQGQPMRAVFGALREMVDPQPDIEVVYPVHLSPAVQEAVRTILGESRPNSSHCAFRCF